MKNFFFFIYLFIYLFFFVFVELHISLFLFFTFCANISPALNFPFFLCITCALQRRFDATENATFTIQKLSEREAPWRGLLLRARPRPLRAQPARRGAQAPARGVTAQGGAYSLHRRVASGQRRRRRGWRSK